MKHIPKRTDVAVECNCLLSPRHSFPNSSRSKQVPISAVKQDPFLSRLHFPPSLGSASKLSEEEHNSLLWIQSLKSTCDGSFKKLQIGLNLDVHQDFSF